MAELSVELRAKITDLKKQLKLANADLIKTGSVADDTAEKVGSIGSKGMKTLKKSTLNATPAVQEFSRVIQDAPYGIQGVANNIQQLTANFGHLSQQAGGTKAALKAMVSSLIGPAGILLAVSVVTTLMVSFGDKIFKSKKEVESLNDRLGKYISKLRGVEKAQLNSQKNAAKELITLKQLRGQIEDVGSSMGKRIDGIKKLRAEFPAYFQGISNEKLLNGQAAASYDVLTNSIVKRARATAATDLLVANAKKEFELSKKLSDLNKTIDKQRLDAYAKEDKANNKQESFLGNTIANTKILEAAQDKLNASKKEAIEIEDELAKLTKENLELESVVTANVVVEPVFKKFDSKSFSLTDSLPTPSPDELAEVFGLTDEATEAIGRKAEKLAFDTSVKLNKGWDFIRPEALESKLSAIEQIWSSFYGDLQVLKETALADGIFDIGQSIGEALAEGGNVIKAIGSSLLSSFGQFLSEFGKRLIEYGVAALAFSKVSQALTNPITAAPAAVAAIAAGTALSIAGAALSSAASGGLGESTVSGQGSGSSSNYSNTGGVTSYSGDGEVVFKISGTNLIGVLNRASSKNLRLGNG